MISIRYSGSLKKDIDCIRERYDFRKENFKRLLFGFSFSVCTVFGAGLMSFNNLEMACSFFSVLCTSVGITLVRSQYKENKLEKRKKKALKKILDLSYLMDVSDLMISSKNVENAIVSKDYVTYKDLSGEEKREEVRNYYIENKEGKLLILSEMRNELAGMLDTGYIHASLEVTGDKSVMETDYSYGLYLVEGHEYKDISCEDKHGLIKIKR